MRLTRGSVSNSCQLPSNSPISRLNSPPPHMRALTDYVAPGPHSIGSRRFYPVLRLQDVASVPSVAGVGCQVGVNHFANIRTSTVVLYSDM
jgi:hypothetical protein